MSPDKHIVLLVDGHSSRDGLEWISACERMKIIVVRLPANTAHILQPCDQFVNRSLQRKVRETRDHVLSMSHLSWENTAYKINLAVAGHQAISPEDARSSFTKCGLWPVNYRFVRFATVSESNNPSSRQSENVSCSRERLLEEENQHMSARVINMKLQSEIHKVTDGQLPASQALAKVSCLLSSDYRVQRILESEIRAPKMASINRAGRKKGGKMQEAAVLTSKVFQANTQKKRVLQMDTVSEEAFICHSRTPSNNLDCEKENRSPVRGDNVARNLESIF